MSRLAWAARYRVSIYRGSQLVWSSTSDTMRLVPAGPIPLQRGIAYEWQVDALDVEGGGA